MDEMQRGGVKRKGLKTPAFQVLPPIIEGRGLLESQGKKGRGKGDSQLGGALPAKEEGGGCRVTPQVMDERKQLSPSNRKREKKNF